MENAPGNEGAIASGNSMPERMTRVEVQMAYTVRTVESIEKKLDVLLEERAARRPAIGAAKYVIVAIVSAMISAAVSVVKFPHA